MYRTRTKCTGIIPHWCEVLISASNLIFIAKIAIISYLNRLTDDYCYCGLYCLIGSSIFIYCLLTTVVMGDVA
jgi:hypothetical protein